MIGQDTMNRLVKIGDEHGCELLMPPFNNSNNPFYCVKDIRDDHTKFFDFLTAVGDTKVKFGWTKLDGESQVNYMEIEG